MPDITFIYIYQANREIDHVQIMIAPTGGYANRMHIRPLLHGAVVDGANEMYHRAFEVYLDRLIAKPSVVRTHDLHQKFDEHRTIRLVGV